MAVFWKKDSGRLLRLITPENEGGDETSAPSPRRFDDREFPLNSPDTPSAPPGPPDSPGQPPGLPPAPPPGGGKGRARAENESRERSRPRSQSPEPQLKPIPKSDDDDDQSPQDERQRQRSRSRERVHPYGQAPQTHQYQRHKRHQYHQHSQWFIQEPFTVPDEYSGSSGRRPRSRSRERAPVHVPIHTGDESAATEPQGRVSDRSRSPQGKASPQRQKGKKTTVEVKMPRDLPKVKKRKPMDSNGDDEAPQNEPGTSSNTQPPIPVLLLGNTGYKGPPHSRTAQKTPSLVHVSNQKRKLHLKRHWIPQMEVQPLENPWQESSIYL